MRKHFFIYLSYATFGIVVENEVVVKTPPIANWMKNKTIFFIIDWVKQKKGVIEEISTDKELINQERLISDIKNRIFDEYRKHKKLDWPEIAARKIVKYLKSNEYDGIKS